jgi:rhamnopyranosyl-N-acetylglucosaminyl-diphospho-decaprenol beta-1,3/1,4-galactofuranosyltransferase
VTERMRDHRRGDFGSESKARGLSTAAVLVTHNRFKLFQRSLQSVLDQTLSANRIVVVDNHSTDGTVEWLLELAKDRPDIEIILLQENKGSSGGFCRGIRAAYEAGADWIWTMDDDTIADPDALEKLVARIKPLPPAAVKKVGYVCSKVVWEDGSRHVLNVPVPNRFWWDGYDVIPGSIQIEAATFVSALFNRRAVEAVGLPVEEFFIWWDDVEYTLRMSSAGFWGYYVDESRVMHLTSENKAAEYCYVNDENLWKYRYGLRNEVSVSKRRGRGRITAFWRIVVRVLEMREHGIPARLIMPLVLWGLKGYFFDYRKLIAQVKGP